MKRLEITKQLRADPDVHYNCCQSVLVPFCDVCGIDRETAVKLGAHFGGGMRHGSTCGAVTGALMVLGMAGEDEQAARKLMNAVREKHGALDCAHLLARAKEEGIERNAHCEGMMLEAVDLLEQIMDLPDEV